MQDLFKAIFFHGGPDGGQELQRWRPRMIILQTRNVRIMMVSGNTVRKIDMRRKPSEFNDQFVERLS